MGIEKRRTSGSAESAVAVAADGPGRPTAGGGNNNAAGRLNGGRSPPAPHLTRRRQQQQQQQQQQHHSSNRCGNASARPASSSNNSGNPFFAHTVRIGLLLLLSIWVLSFLAILLTMRIDPTGLTPAGRRIRTAEQVAENKWTNVLSQAEQWEARILERGAEIERQMEKVAVEAVRHRLKRDLRGSTSRTRGDRTKGAGAGGDGERHRHADQLRHRHAGPSKKKRAAGGSKPSSQSPDGMWEHGDGYHYRADRAALAKVRTPIAITTNPSDTTDANHDYIDMRDLTATLPFDNPDGGAWKQGWDVEPTPLDPANPLTVFVVPHSHCDPGWIKTFDEYFRSQTSGIITSIYHALCKDRRRKFIWAEISYFEWWWREQDGKTQKKMRELIQNGQFEFVTGGWVQPDEANTQRYAIEVQLQEGHDWLRSTFGEEVLPRYGWSIDPFGYSPTMADVLKDYGFEGMLIQRVHYAVKKELAKRKHLEFNWRQTYDETGRRDMFTHVMPFYSYDVPHTCGPDPSVCCQFDFARLKHDYGGCPWHKEPQHITPSNVAERATLLLDQYQKKASLYRSNVVLAPLGDDFRYRTDKEAEQQYTNYQKIMDYLNNNVPGVQIQFGTLSDYFNAVRGTFVPPVLKGSFFTYADRDEDYWSGYFTSRVFDKALDRKLEQVLFAASAMGATAEEMREPRRSLSLFQHHDGVTGTAKDHVVEDYARYMHNAINKVQEWMVGSVEASAGASSLKPCWKAKTPRALGHFACDLSKPTYIFNPLPVDQTCGNVVVPAHKTVEAMLPCEKAGSETGSSAIKFDKITGMMTHPIKEEWMVWKVQRGGAYLFFPGRMAEYLKDRNEDVTIEEGGFVVSTSRWKRTIVEKKIPDESAEGSATVLDFIFKTNLEVDNEEWFVRFTVPISNDGIFHTDLNGANFDTHHFRRDLPVQSQVFPMPTLASIEDTSRRFTVLSEHAQGTASLQNGSIDVWLDRRLRRDDERGLGQGVRDNVLTRTRLRLLLETEEYDIDPSTEFEITKLCKKMWDELNHPLEVFGTHKGGGEGAGAANGNANQGDSPSSLVEAARKFFHLSSAGEGNAVPFVYMVHKRVDDFKHAIESLRNSDFPKDRVPLIISHDGHVPEMVEYVETLKSEFNVKQMFHPHACYDHPKSFPADAAELNENYDGDLYGNKRSSWATCAKHHWSWMMRHVFDDMDFGSKLNVDSMFFMEEDYVVSPTIYNTVTQGLHLAGKNRDYFGIILDITNGGVHEKRGGEEWHELTFRTGPMAISRMSWQKIVDARDEFCNYDEYNWDWSVVHLMAEGLVPYKVLAPSFPQVQHIGLDGMHVNSEEVETRAGKRDKMKLRMAAAHWTTPRPFHGTGVVHRGGAKIPRKGGIGGIGKPNGGWGHPKDHEHCLNVLGPKWLKLA